MAFCYNCAPVSSQAVSDLLSLLRFLCGTVVAIRFITTLMGNSRMENEPMIRKFLKDESGMETLEYAVIAGLVAAVAVLVYSTGWGTVLSTRLLAASNAT